MKYRNKDITTQETKFSEAKLRTEIKKNDLLCPYIGQWSKSSRVKGWGHFHGYIQTSTIILDVIQSPNELKSLGVRVRKVHNILGVSVKLLCEHNNAKKGWTTAHLDELKRICSGYGVTDIQVIN